MVHDLHTHLFVMFTHLSTYVPLNRMAIVDTIRLTSNIKSNLKMIGIIVYILYEVKVELRFDNDIIFSF